MDKYSAITGLFGNFTKLHKTDVENAYVVTTIKDTSFPSYAKSLGWTAVVLDEPHTYDLKAASIQSKYVKTLKYFNPNTEYVLYVDHKYQIQSKHIKYFIDNIGKEPLLSFYSHKSIYEEFYDSMHYQRYHSDMHKIITSINAYSRQIINSTQLFYTGLILYNTQHKDFKDIVFKLNESLNKHLHNECQILFPLALHNITKTLIHNTIGLKHNTPEELIPDKMY